MDTRGRVDVIKEDDLQLRRGITPLNNFVDCMVTTCVTGQQPRSL
jgi:hypothetical protein